MPFLRVSKVLISPLPAPLKKENGIPRKRGGSASGAAKKSSGKEINLAVIRTMAANMARDSSRLPLFCNLLTSSLSRSSDANGNNQGRLLVLCVLRYLLQQKGELKNARDRLVVARALFLHIATAFKSQEGHGDSSEVEEEGDEEASITQELSSYLSGSRHKGLFSFLARSLRALITSLSTIATVQKCYSVVLSPEGKKNVNDTQEVQEYFSLLRSIYIFLQSSRTQHTSSGLRTLFHSLLPTTSDACAFLFPFLAAGFEEKGMCSYMDIRIPLRVCLRSYHMTHALILSASASQQSRPSKKKKKGGNKKNNNSVLDTRVLVGVLVGLACEAEVIRHAALCCLDTISNNIDALEFAMDETQVDSSIFTPFLTLLLKHRNQFLVDSTYLRTFFTSSFSGQSDSALLSLLVSHLANMQQNGGYNTYAQHVLLSAFQDLPLSKVRFLSLSFSLRLLKNVLNAYPSYATLISEPPPNK